MLAIAAAFAVYLEPRKNLLPLGIIFIAFTWTILTIRFVNLLSGDAEGLVCRNDTDDDLGALIDDVINATAVSATATTA